MADTYSPSKRRAPWHLLMRATADRTARTAQLTDKGRQYVAAMKRREALKRAEQAAVS